MFQVQQRGIHLINALIELPVIDADNANTIDIWAPFTFDLYVSGITLSADLLKAIELSHEVERCKEEVIILEEERNNLINYFSKLSFNSHVNQCCLKNQAFNMI